MKPGRRLVTGWTRRFPASMQFLNPPQKPSSRFSTLNVFKLRPGASPAIFTAHRSPPADAAPPPPPKDASPFYNRSFFSRSAASLVPSLSPATPSEFGISHSPLAANGRAAAPSPAPSASGRSLRSLGRVGGDYLASPSMEGSTDSSGSSSMYRLHGASSSAYAMNQPAIKPKKGVFRLAGLAKRNRSRKDLSDTASASDSVSRSTSVNEHEKAEGDEGITLPWNFQVGTSSDRDNTPSYFVYHSTTYMSTRGECPRLVFAHTCDRSNRYIGLPPSWSAALSQVGFDEDEIAAIHARRRAAATGLASNTKLHTTYSTERPPSPRASTATPPSTTLLEPLPRSTSLGKRRDNLTIHPPSIYSVATSTAAPTSSAPSPRTPSFLMKSLVSGIKHSLTSDSASVGGSSRGEPAAGEESEQYVFVDGDGPDPEGGDAMGDETLIEPYPYDTSSVSSHQTHTSRIRQMSQVISLGSFLWV